MAFTPDASFLDAAQAILQGLNIQPTPVNLRLLASWIWSEKPHGAGDGWQWNNPLNTTMAGYGGVDVPGNPAGVKQYPSQSAGVAATVATLKLPYYATLVQALETSKPDVFFSPAGKAAIQTWGTDPATVEAVYHDLVLPSGWPQANVSASALPATQPATLPTVSQVLSDLGRFFNLSAFQESAQRGSLLLGAIIGAVVLLLLLEGVEEL
jgi:hypothetical protein